MKRMTASEARRNWFRVLDEVIAGETVVIERKGRRVVLRREGKEGAVAEEAPDYGALIRAPDVGAADTWSWDWDPETGDLTPRDDESA